MLTSVCQCVFKLQGTLHVLHCINMSIRLWDTLHYMHQSMSICLYTVTNFCTLLTQRCVQVSIFIYKTLYDNFIMSDSLFSFTKHCTIFFLSAFINVSTESDSWKWIVGPFVGLLGLAILVGLCVCLAIRRRKQKGKMKHLQSRRYWFCQLVEWDVEEDGRGRGEGWGGGYEVVDTNIKVMTSQRLWWLLR